MSEISRRKQIMLSRDILCLSIFAVSPNYWPFSLSLAKIVSLSEKYLEPYRTSTMELFCENSLHLLAVNCFHKKFPS